MRAQILALAFLVAGCADSIADYCGAPEAVDSAWTAANGGEMSAGECRDALVGTWEGTIPFAGGTEVLSLTFAAPGEAPVEIGYPHAGENSPLVQVEDSCLDRTEFILPTEATLARREVTLEMDVTLSVTAFSGGWRGEGQATLPHCEDNCDLIFSVVAPRPADALMSVLLEIETHGDEFDRVSGPPEGEEWGAVARVD